jgi:indolepyruvate ferredoxin oxidoreductase
VLRLGRTLKLFRWLAKAQVRGSRWDRLPERRAERQLIADYEDDVALILARLAPATHDAAVELASLPEKIRGFGHVKAASIGLARKRRDELRRDLETGTP